MSSRAPSMVSRTWSGRKSSDSSSSRREIRSQMPIRAYSTFRRGRVEFRLFLKGLRGGACPREVGAGGGEAGGGVVEAGELLVEVGDEGGDGGALGATLGDGAVEDFGDAAVELVAGGGDEVVEAAGEVVDDF